MFKVHPAGLLWQHAKAKALVTAGRQPSPTGPAPGCQPPPVATQECSPGACYTTQAYPVCRVTLGLIVSDAVDYLEAAEVLPSLVARHGYARATVVQHRAAGVPRAAMRRRTRSKLAWKQDSCPASPRFSAPLTAAACSTMNAALPRLAPHPAVEPGSLSSGASSELRSSLSALARRGEDVMLWYGTVRAGIPAGPPPAHVARGEGAAATRTVVRLRSRH